MDLNRAMLKTSPASMENQQTQTALPDSATTTAVTAEKSNHSHVYGTLAGDFAAAAASATLVAPTVTLMDRSIVEMLASRKSLLQGIRSHALTALRHPAKFIFSKPFGLVWTLYAGTYAVANSAETLSNEFHRAATGTITFVSTMLVNVPLGVWKDLRFARYFGAGSDAGRTPVALTSRSVPRAAAATFLLRDAVTIHGCFTLAPWLSAAVPDHLAANPHVKMAVTQMTVPMLSQVVATPIHLLGLDLYSRQHGVVMAERMALVRRDLPSATVVRCIRILPAFGFGCVANLEMREYFHKLMGVK